MTFGSVFGRTFSPTFQPHSLAPAAASSWWLAGGIAAANCVAAYQAKGAADYAASKVNLANPGTYNAGDGAAYPTWDATNGWVFNNANDQYLDTGVVANALTWTYIMFYTDLAYVMYAGLFGAYDTGTSANLVERYDTPSMFRVHNGGQANGYNGAANHGVIVLTNKSVYIGSILKSIAITAGGTPSTKSITIGCVNGLNKSLYCMTGQSKGFALYDTELTQAQIIKVVAASGNYTGLLVFDGDSLTYGFGVTAGSDYPSVLINSLSDSRPYLLNNLGVAGQTVVQMIADAATQIDVAVDMQGITTKKIAIWGGINDIVVQGNDAETVYDNIVTYCTARKSVGWNVTVCTIIAAGSASNPNELIRLAVNEMIVANYTSFADNLADIAANEYFDAKSDTTNTTYYNADTVHLTATGYALVAGIVKSAMGLA